MQRLATTPDDFVDHFGQKQNFLIGPQCIEFGLSFPPVEEVIDILRQDPASKVRAGDELAADDAFCEWVRSAPLETVIDEGHFGLSNFELAAFYGPGQFLHRLQDEVMIPWRTLLASMGFTWQRCAPYIFISTAGVSSTYHADFSHVVAWQLEGEKTFNGFLDPDKYAPIHQNIVRGSFERTPKPPPYDPDDVLAYHMGPGDLLWNHLLTPHWVDAGKDRPAMSLNISHGLVRHRGQFSPNEALLHQRWQEHPEEAWLSDLRY
jgi:hypothetical protein